MGRDEGLDPTTSSVRAIIAADARRPQPSPAVRERVLARLEASLGFAPAPHRRGAPAWLRWAAALGALTAASATAFVLTRQPPPVVEPMLVPRELPQRPLVPPAATRVVPPEPPRPRRRAPRPPKPAIAVAPPVTAPPAVPTVASAVDLASERQLLESARRALAARNGSTALFVLGEHERRHPDGWLAEERESMRVQAFVLVGRKDDARLAGGQFRRRWPTSIFAPVVEAALASIH